MPLDNTQMINQSLPIPEHKMGWMIGKGGSYIKQLSLKSGAWISISESSSKEYGRTWKYIQIKGNGRAVDKAKKLIHIRLERLEPRAEDGEFNPVDPELLGDVPDDIGDMGLAQEMPIDMNDIGDMSEFSDIPPPPSSSAEGEVK